MQIHFKKLPPMGLKSVGLETGAVELLPKWEGDTNKRGTYKDKHIICLDIGIYPYIVIILWGMIWSILYLLKHTTQDIA